MKLAIAQAAGHDGGTRKLCVWIGLAFATWILAGSLAVPIYIAYDTNDVMLFGQVGDLGMSNVVSRICRLCESVVTMGQL